MTGASHFCARSNMKRRTKIDPIARLVEGILDCALIAGLVAAIGFLMSIMTRVVF
jgi:hypothetical protein